MGQPELAGADHPLGGQADAPGSSGQRYARILMGLEGAESTMHCTCFKSLGMDTSWWPVPVGHHLPVLAEIDKLILNAHIRISLLVPGQAVVHVGRPGISQGGALGDDDPAGSISFAILATAKAARGSANAPWMLLSSPNPIHCIG